jgi:hypothetical protein
MMTLTDDCQYSLIADVCSNIYIIEISWKIVHFIFYTFNMLNELRLALEWKELIVIRNKFEHIEYDSEGNYQEVKSIRRSMTISSDVIDEFENFKNLGSFVQKYRTLV